MQSRLQAPTVLIDTKNNNFPGIPIKGAEDDSLQDTESESDDSFEVSSYESTVLYKSERLQRIHMKMVTLEEEFQAGQLLEEARVVSDSKLYLKYLKRKEDNDNDPAQRDEIKFPDRY